MQKDYDVKAATSRQEQVSKARGQAVIACNKCRCLNDPPRTASSRFCRSGESWGAWMRFSSRVAPSAVQGRTYMIRGTYMQAHTSMSIIEPNVHTQASIQASKQAHTCTPNYLHAHMPTSKQTRSHTQLQRTHTNARSHASMLSWSRTHLQACTLLTSVPSVASVLLQLPRHPSPLPRCLQRQVPPCFLQPH